MALADLKLCEFLSNSRISEEIWKAASIEWSTLQAIGIHFEKHADSLRQTAAFFANEIQKIAAVHSVRVRIKDAEHLLAKIVRKRAQGINKYLEINLENYFETVTDLIGIRALHLFKPECLEIVKELRTMWEPIEIPIAYTRSGDNAELGKLFEGNGLEVKEHPSGYRSVHYVFQAAPVGRKLVTEVQIRTVFEEAWSEIDHRVRYPNFSNNATLENVLTIFNRMAGSADEMGSFVLDLERTISKLESDAANASAEKNTTIHDMEKELNELQKLKAQDEDSKRIIEKLKAEVYKLKEQNRETAPVASNELAKWLTRAGEFEILSSASKSSELARLLDSANAFDVNTSASNQNRLARGLRSATEWIPSEKIATTQNELARGLRAGKERETLEKMAGRQNELAKLHTLVKTSDALQWTKQQDELAKWQKSATEWDALRKVTTEQNELAKFRSLIGKVPPGTDDK